MTLANQVSILRLLLVPMIVASLVYYHPDRDGLRFLTLGLFLLGVLTDAIDGYLARRWNQRTELGTWLDPLADKALILGTLISCSVIQGLPEALRIPAWFNLLVISRDVILVGGTMILFTLKGHVKVRPSWIGKCTTVAQMAVIISVLAGAGFRDQVIVLAASLTALSAIGYMRAGVKALG
jgi:CDP-diacylglycerol--glycerol-3-phosphate 3-phosphatidyltransferase